MNIEKFTDRAKGFLQSAQTVAIRNNNQRVAPEHVLKALLEDDEGMAANLIRAAGGNPDTAVQLTDQAIAKIPQVSGGGAQQLSWDNDTVRVLDSEGSGDATTIARGIRYAVLKGAQSDYPFNRAYMYEDRAAARAAPPDMLP